MTALARAQVNQFLDIMPQGGRMTGLLILKHKVAAVAGKQQVRD